MLKLKPLALTLMTTALAPAAISQAAPEEKVYLEADTLVDDKDAGRIIAEGDVLVKYENRELRADRIIYTVADQIVRASGNVRITDADGSVRFADEIEVDDRLGDGVATGFTAQLPQDALVVARAVSRKANGTNTLDHAVYTACEVCEANDYKPTWALRARTAEQNAETQMITYEDAVLELKGVPVFYAPYFAHPDPSSERRSGLLMPTPRLSSTLGAVYEQPYYWAISPSQDLTITPKIYTKVNPSLGLDYRKRFWSGTLDVDMSFAYDYEFNDDAERQVFNAETGRVVRDPETFTGETYVSEESLRSHFFAEGEFDINQDWKWGFGLARASDDLYIDRYDIQNSRDKRGIYAITGRNLLSQIFAVRQTTNFYGDVAALSIQSLKENVDDSTLGEIMPIAFAEQIFDGGEYGFVTLQGSALVLNRDIGDDSRRFTGQAKWENAYVAPAGIVFEPMAKLRADYYDYSFDATDTTPEIEDSDTRTTALAAATFRWPFINRASFGNVRVEPIVTFAYSDVSIENGVLPNEDSAFYEYTMPVAFEADPFTNFDLVEDGGRIAAGVRAETHFNSGLRVNGALARRWREEADPGLVPGTNLNGSESDYLIGAGMEYMDYFRFGTNLRVNDDMELQRSEFYGDLEIGPVQLSASYFDLSEDVAFGTDPNGVEGIEIDGEFGITDNIKLLYTRSRNIEQGRNVKEGFGIEFFDDCSFFRITYLEQDLGDTREVGTGDSIKFTFGLRTIGEVNDNTFD